MLHKSFSEIQRIWRSPQRQEISLWRVTDNEYILRDCIQETGRYPVGVSDIVVRTSNWEEEPTRYMPVNFCGQSMQAFPEDEFEGEFGLAHSLGEYRGIALFDRLISGKAVQFEEIAGGAYLLEQELLKGCFLRSLIPDYLLDR